eukprot:CAMPEP_0113856998 /NCGR_PEP_ID=MMETSP0372-20130328/9756_1 /TAXON_ID=340204 /ORGANISM="Lankesteria abbotti" /LENGTH=144 /DNA_ID=CAMNT_0000832479 /DNA_START=39 /DNA_END=469 /DNA_ORIENTATION=- /assembly_acc=CAM_ASM_000359
MRYQETLYLHEGGDPKWLMYLRLIPDKLKRIQPLNIMLAHCPWRITASFMASLMIGEMPWTSTELCEVVLILTQFHSYSSLSLGLGIIDAQDYGLPIVVDDPTIWKNDDLPGCFREQYEDPIFLAADYWNTSGKRSDSSHATTT